MPAKASSKNPPALQPMAVWLSALAVLPFLIYAILLWLPPEGVARWGLVTPPETGLVFYASIMLAFTGGMHWTLAVTHPAVKRRRVVYLQSALPVLMGWICLLLPDWQLALMGLIIGFGVMAVLDYRMAEGGIWQPWFLRVRLLVTVGVLIALIAALLRPVSALL